MFQPLYSTYHNYYNISGENENKEMSYMSCLEVGNSIKTLMEGK